MQRFTLSCLILFLILPFVTFADDKLVVFSGRSDKFVKPVIKKFTDKTGIKVLLHSAKSTALVNKLKLEGNRTDADLFISNDAGNLQQGSELGLFSAIPEKISKRIPANYRSSDNTWIGLSARARVLVVNTKSGVENKLLSIFDLAQPEFKNKIAITHSANGSFIAGATVYMLAKDEKQTLNWLKGLEQNAGRNVFNKHSKVVKAVAKGSADVGLVNHYYIFRHLAKHPNAPIKLLLPDQGGSDMGLAWNVAGVAISKHSKKKRDAIKLVEFLTSLEGQRIFAEVNKEYPTRTDVNAAAELPLISTIKIADVPMEMLGKKRNATMDLIDKAGLQ